MPVGADQGQHLVGQVGLDVAAVLRELDRERALPGGERLERRGVRHAGRGQAGHLLVSDHRELASASRGRPARRPRSGAPRAATAGSARRGCARPPSTCGATTQTDTKFDTIRGWRLVGEVDRVDGQMADPADVQRQMEDALAALRSTGTRTVRIRWPLSNTWSETNWFAAVRRHDAGHCERGVGEHGADPAVRRAPRSATSSPRAAASPPPADGPGPGTGGRHGADSDHERHEKPPHMGRTYQIAAARQTPTRATATPVAAAEYSASIARAWPSASSRPSSGGASPRTAADMFSTSSRYGFAASTAIRSTPSWRRSSITGSTQCHGSSRNSVALVADDLELVAHGLLEADVEVRKHVAGEAHRRRHRDVDAVAAGHLLGEHALGLAGDQSRAAHAVAAEIHQRAAVEARAAGARSRARA